MIILVFGRAAYVLINNFIYQIKLFIHSLISSYLNQTLVTM